MGLKNKSIDMTCGPLIPKLLMFVIPIALSLLLQMLYNTADLLVIGKFGSSNSLGAVGATNAPTNLLVGFFTGLSIGANIVCAKGIGAKDYESVSKSVFTSIFSGFLLGIVVGIAGYFLSAPMLILMNCDGTLLELATTYMKIIFLGTPFTIVYNYAAAILRSKGDTTKPLFYLALSGIINVILNLFFVLVFHLDVAGVAIATITSQAISMVMVLIDLFHDDSCCKLIWKFDKFDFHLLFLVLAIGVPTGLQSVMYSITNIITKANIIYLGDAVINGDTVSGNLNGYSSIISTVFSQAVMAFVAQNYGAKNIKYVKKIFATTIILSTSIMALASIIIIAFAKPLISIYSNDISLYEYALTGILICQPFYIVWGFSEISMGVSKGLGSTIVPMLITGIATCVFRIIFIYTVVPYYNTYAIIEWIYPISWAISALLEFIWAIHIYRKTLRKVEIESTNLEMA